MSMLSIFFAHPCSQRFLPPLHQPPCQELELPHEPPAEEPPPPRSPPGAVTSATGAPGGAAAAAAALLLQPLQLQLPHQPVMHQLCLLLQHLHLPRCPLCDHGRISMTVARYHIDLVLVFKLLHVRQRRDGNEKQ